MDHRAASVAVCFALDAGPLAANPSGPTVVHGSVGFNGLGTGALTITNQAGGNAIINWNGFSIGTNELTRFQQFANLAVLNRVTGGDVSRILGALRSDGRVFLINPNGIVFGASARIDTAGLVSSSLALSDQDFLGGRLRFTEVPGAGAVVNNGVIETATGGRVYLVAPSVQNNGLVQSPKGASVNASLGGTGTPSGGDGGDGGNVGVYGAGVVQLNIGGTLVALALDVSGGPGGAGNPATSPAGDGGDGGDGGTAYVLGTYLPVQSSM